MKICVKKIYCSACRKLVKCHEQVTNGAVHVLCSKCGRLLRVWNHIGWRSL